MRDTGQTFLWDVVALTIWCLHPCWCKLMNIRVTGRETWRNFSWLLEYLDDYLRVVANVSQPKLVHLFTRTRTRSMHRQTKWRTNRHFFILSLSVFVCVWWSPSTVSISQLNQGPMPGVATFISIQWGPYWLTWYTNIRLHSPEQTH